MLICHMSPWSFSHINHMNSLYRTVLYRPGPSSLWLPFLPHLQSGASSESQSLGPHYTQGKGGFSNPRSKSGAGEWILRPAELTLTCRSCSWGRTPHPRPVTYACFARLHPFCEARHTFVCLSWAGGLFLPENRSPLVSPLLSSLYPHEFCWLAPRAGICCTQVLLAPSFSIMLDQTLPQPIKTRAEDPRSQLCPRLLCPLQWPRMWPSS